MDTTIKEIKGISFPKQDSNIVTNWLQNRKIRARIFFQLFRNISHKTGTINAIKILLRLRKEYQEKFAEPMYSKIAKVGNHYYWRLMTPGFPSKALDRVQNNEIDRLMPFFSFGYLRTLILAITRKCPMNCEHCYEWNNLHKAEVMTIDDLVAIVKSFQEHGTSQIFFGGGEPMVRYPAIGIILKNAFPDTQFWMYTSGFQLNEEKAMELKNNGMTGIMVSLDHYLADKHDVFRGVPGTFNNAINAVLAVKKVGLVSGLALCATNEFCTETNLINYLELAKSLGVTFVQILEPKPAGRYAGKNVRLHPGNIKMLEEFTYRYNTNKKLEEYPIINYSEALIRKTGCLSGDRLAYINSIGEIQKCPFCPHTEGKAASGPIHQILENIRKAPCPDYNHSSELICGA